MPAAIIMAFMWAPPAEILGESSRIIYFHVPLAWVSVVSFVLAGIWSIIYLREKEREESHLPLKAHNSVIIGLFFTTLTIITGSIWAKISWGTYWNWDPRETSIVILLLIYLAYLSLHTSIRERNTRNRISASYLIFAMATVPFFIFIVPRVYSSLHPDTIINAEKQVHLEGEMTVTLIVSIVSFTLLFTHILSLMNRYKITKQRLRGDEE